MPETSQTKETINKNTPEGANADRKHILIEPAVPAGGLFYRFIKRGADIFCSLIAGIFLLIPMLVIALIIKINDPKGPVIYKQVRTGRGGREFTILKFRTMRVDAEANGAQWASADDDERCTSVGRKLRKCRLDELPQLWNIFVGHMTMVGPRPERPCFYEEFETYIHGFSHRLAVRPGLTGLAQVSGGYDLPPEEKIIYDMEYIRTRSIGLDLKLLFRTVKVIFTHEGAR